MSDCLVITWDSSELCLSRFPWQGTWQSPAHSLLSKVSLLRPTRIERALIASTRESLTSALREVFVGNETDLPIWFLIPPSWTFSYIVQCPELPSQEATLDHLIWESIQRINGDVTPYRMLAPHAGAGACEVISVRGKLIDLIAEAASSADIVLDGISVQPIQDDIYFLEPSRDLRKAEPLIEESDTEYLSGTSSRRVPIFAFVIIFFAMISLGIYWFLYSGNDQQPEMASKDIEQTAPDSDGLTSEISMDMEGPTDSSLTKVEEEAYMPPSVSVNPLRGVWQSLPAGAAIEFVVISPADMRMEISGLVNSAQWLEKTRMLRSLSEVKIDGRFDGFAGKSIAMVHLSRCGFSESSGANSLTTFNKLATSSGMTVGKKQTVWGSFESAVKLVEQLWDNPNGIQKLYIFPEQQRWGVTFR